MAQTEQVFQIWGRLKQQFPGEDAFTFQLAGMVVSKTSVSWRQTFLESLTPDQFIHLKSVRQTPSLLESCILDVPNPQRLVL